MDDPLLDFVKRAQAAQKAVDEILQRIDRGFVIWSFEHEGWWRPGGYGYTTNLDEAGHYTTEEARRIVVRANIITVEEHMVPLTDLAERYCGHCHQFD